MWWARQSPLNVWAAPKLGTNALLLLLLLLLLVLLLQSQNSALHWSQLHCELQNCTAMPALCRTYTAVDTVQSPKTWSNSASRPECLCLPGHCLTARFLSTHNQTMMRNIGTILLFPSDVIYLTTPRYTQSNPIHKSHKWKDTLSQSHLKSCSCFYCTFSVEELAPPFARF